MAGIAQVFPHVIAWLDHYLGALENPLVLEAGCGAGHYAKHISNGRYVSFDLPQTWYEIERPVSVHASADALPFRDAVFDFGFCVSSFDYFPNPAQVMIEIARCLKPGASFLVFTYDKETLDQIHRNCEALPSDPTMRGHHVFDRNMIMSFGSTARLDGEELTYLPSMDLILRAKLIMRPTNFRVFAFRKAASVQQ